MNQDFDKVKSIKFVNSDVVECEDLSFLQFLERVELQQNQLQNLKFIQDCKDVTYLNASNNKIDSIHVLSPLCNLKVLNVAHCEIKQVPPMLLSSLPNLRALVINNNQLKSFPRTSKKHELRTLVISHNEIDSLTGISQFSMLEKLSASNNSIRAIPESEIKELKQLQELRLAHNKIITIPSSISECVQLKILNLTHNFIQSLEYVVFASLFFC